jgi:hypothetical protein
MTSIVVYHISIRSVVIAASRKANVLIKSTVGQGEMVERETIMPMNNESKKLGEAIDEGAED